MQPNPYLSPEELERRFIEPFVRRHFPFVPQALRPNIAMVRPGRALIAGRTTGRPAQLPAQYSYTYVCEDGDCRQIIYVLADAQGNILRALTSK